MAYADDRKFTDKVHNNLAMKIIYPKLKWTVQDINKRLGNSIDMQNGVDYVAIDQRTTTPQMVTIQERFREVKYRNYSDFTLRYMRPENPDESRRLSEYYKIDAQYMVYGTIDTSKEDVDKATKFVKYAVVNLDKLKDAIDAGKVVIDEELTSRVCQKDGDKMRCPVNPNWDHSSNFVPFDISILIQIAPGVVEYQEGFVN